MSENEKNSEQSQATSHPTALRFALLWFGIPLVVFLVLAYLTRG